MSRQSTAFVSRRKRSISDSTGHAEALIRWALAGRLTGAEVDSVDPSTWDDDVLAVAWVYVASVHGSAGRAVRGIGTAARLDRIADEGRPPERAWSSWSLVMELVQREEPADVARALIERMWSVLTAYGYDRIGDVFGSVDWVRFLGPRPAFAGGTGK